MRIIWNNSASREKGNNGMKETQWRFIREFLIIAATTGIVGVLISNPMHLYERGGWRLIWEYYWRGGVGVAILWQGNAYLSNLPDRWVNWVDTPVLRLVVSTVITIVYTVIAWVLIYWLFLTRGYGWNLFGVIRDMGLQDFIPTIIITLFISIFMHGRAFLIGWKNALVEAERLKKEQISARYEALKNQVNPHFLFNSLNVLSSLVHKDADQAEQFIRRLSTVYRYILESRDKEVVSLEEELEVLRAFLFMLDIRFGASLQTDVRLHETATGKIAPLTLQMLVENALKHNEVSKASPLRLEIFQENGYLVVRNNIQPKNMLPDSTGVGLANIQARYRVLTGKDVLITDTDGFFTVKVPFIQQT